MPTCFVPGCQSGYLKTVKKNKAEGKKNPSLFSPPADPETFKLWERSILRSDRPLTRKEKVCSLHFDDDDIIKFEQLKLKDGTIWRQERGNYVLKKGAVPSIIFPDCPNLTTSKYKRMSRLKKKLNKNIYKRKKQEDVHNVKVEEVREVDTVIEFENALPSTCTTTDQAETRLQIDFQTLKQQAAEIKLPENWTHCPMDTLIMFLKWTDNTFTCIQRRINITSDLIVRTFLYSEEVRLKNFTKVENISAIDDLIRFVNDMKICKSVGCNKINEM